MKISKEQILIYLKYECNVDAFARFGKADKSLRMNDESWSVIDSVLQDLELVKSDLCSDGYKTRFIKKLNEKFEADAIELLQTQVGL